jgi:hypothetical protein
MSEKTDAITLQYLEALRLAAYNSFNDRRSYEWKLSLAIWTAIAVLIAGLVQGEKFPFIDRRFGIAATIFGLFVVGMHFYFNVGIARANSIDKLRERVYSNLIMSIAGIQDKIDLQSQQQKNDCADRPTDHELLVSLIRHIPQTPKSAQMQWKQWGHLTQLFITVGLVALALAVVWIRALTGPTT